jgi:hypothetical protein
MNGFLARWAEERTGKKVASSSGDGQEKIRSGPDAGSAKTYERSPECADVPAADDFTLIEARHEIAGLLATAYRRLAAIPPVGGGTAGQPVKNELANSLAQSVHGVVE